MKKLLPLCALAAIVALSACNKKKSDQFAGVDGDFVTSTPLSERFEGGANFFSESVTKGQFSPVRFGYDSYAVEAGETSKIQQVATAMDIAGKNKADESSLREAIFMAIDIHNKRMGYADARRNPLRRVAHQVVSKMEDERIDLN